MSRRDGVPIIVLNARHVAQREGISISAHVGVNMSFQTTELQFIINAYLQLPK